MLKNIDPLLGPELLRVLAEMGHGDVVVVADANFTGRRLAGPKPLIRLDGVGLARACRAVLSVLPLDASVAQPVAYMQVSDAPAGHVSEVQREALDELRRAGVGPERVRAVERFAFYDLVREAFAIVQTGELRPYGNFLFAKGVITAEDV
jgi:L-fucose mutarotase